MYRERTWDVVYWRDKSEELQECKDEVTRVARYSQDARVEEFILHGLCARSALAKEQEREYAEHEAEEPDDAEGPWYAELVYNALNKGSQHDGSNPAS